MSFTLSIPTTNGPVSLTLENGTSAILVGANGGGKSRLAVYLENAGGEEIHRISAHRALELKPDVAKIKESKALKGLRFGHADDAVGLHHRVGHRWGAKGASMLLNDFDFLLQVLFAEQSRTALATHQRSRAGSSEEATATKFEQLKIIWEHLLPHRELVFSGDDIQVRVPGNEVLYSAADMSDGERAIFYLIGQILVATENSVLVIDEPELHIHRSIMSKLWDQLENVRPDCALLFITHDLEFAASRVGQKFVIRDYQAAGPTWIVDAVPADTGFSEEVTTLLLGSRRPILFVEGDTNSLDKAVYRCAYPQWTVMPRGSCQDVIHAVATLRSNTAFTRIHCAGVVDADGYEATEIAHLGRMGVVVLPVSEIENLFLLPDISREIAVSEHLPSEEIEERLSLLQNDLLSLAGQPAAIEQVIRMYCLRRIDRSLKRTDLSQETTVEAISVAYQQQTQSLDIQAIAQERRDNVTAAIADRDLSKLLSLVDNKGMLAKAASRLKNTSRGPFEAWLTRMLLNDRAPGLVSALRRVLPEIPQTH
ncbi:MULTISPECIES: AAA family ATPase [Pseudomonas]|uniref:ABC transporter ATP-binding protein n=1 Tax=Pseudomonas fluorescens TaxID=294 RepID=A0A161Z4P1_PSEFL|nr:MULTISPECIES: AAA family ATPase [Pseudomonas]KZN18267.1 ABC transporter ATP-binding protein [Pseudomonas fluorescens]